jgi:hypothetical protein
MAYSKAKLKSSGDKNKKSVFHLSHGWLVQMLFNRVISTAELMYSSTK